MKIPMQIEPGHKKGEMTTASDDMADKHGGNPMRTKLDEIVEEELPREDCGAAHLAIVKKWAGIIAERAFRHGVEQCLKINPPATEYKGVPWKWDVQPAPAEEKKPHGCSLIWCGKGPDHAVHTDRQGCPNRFHPYRHLETYCYECGGHDVRDRRKGERRKHMETRWGYFHPEGIDAVRVYRFGGQPYDTYPDRRGEGDRRKR